MAGLWTPGANFTRLFDLDRYFLNGSGDAVATEITDKAIGSDPHIVPLLGRGELLGGGVVELLETRAIWQRVTDLNKVNRRPSVCQGCGVTLRSFTDRLRSSGRPRVRAGKAPLNCFISSNPTARM
jgi:hypothetical protein